MNNPVASNPPTKKSLRVLYADDMKELRQLLEIVLGRMATRLILSRTATWP